MAISAAEARTDRPSSAMLKNGVPARLAGDRREAASDPSGGMQTPLSKPNRLHAVTQLVPLFPPLASLRCVAPCPTCGRPGSSYPMRDTASWDTQQAMPLLLCETCNNLSHSQLRSCCRRGGGGQGDSYPPQVKLAGQLLLYDASSRQGSSYPVKCAASWVTRTLHHAAGWAINS